MTMPDAVELDRLRFIFILHHGRRKVAASGMKSASANSCSGTTTRAGSPSSLRNPMTASRVPHGQKSPGRSTMTAPGYGF